MRGAKLTVVGKRKKNMNFVFSRPCEKKSKNGISCLGLAKSYGINVIEFMTKEGTWQRLELKYVPEKTC